jgi:hypothetical protein
MPTGTGIDAQIGYAAETTWGTAVTVTRFLPLVSETLGKEIEQVESEGILAGRQVLTTQQWAQGNATVGGEVQHELYDQSFGLLLRAAFGTVSTSSTTHTFWPTPPAVSLTTQVGRPTIYGSVIPFTYEGCRIQSFELAAEAGEIVTWGMNIVAEEETRGTALASVSYATNLRPWVFKSCSLTVDGTTVPVMRYSLSSEFNLTDDRRYLGSTLIGEPLRQDLAAFTGELGLEWGNPSTAGTNLYQRFTNGTESALVFTAASGTLAATITANVRFDGSTPQVSGRGVVEHTVPYKCVAGTLDSQAITAVIVNNDTTA